ncbi:MAG: ligase-associated DNA damage response endonuclease PdeM [Cyanobacteria bacterium P01_A01_bin.135]
MDLQIEHLTLRLLSERAVYLPEQEALLVADLHAGKSETFQQFGIPVPAQVNQGTLTRLMRLCDRLQPKRLFILGDWFHSSYGLVEEVLEPWTHFLAQQAMAVTLIVGNHDRRLLGEVAELTKQLTVIEEMEFAGLWLTHGPEPPAAGRLTLCGHVHPCIRLRSALDNLRLPCFYWDRPAKMLILPSFGEFTGGYELPLSAEVTAFAVAETELVVLGSLPGQPLSP